MDYEPESVDYNYNCSFCGKEFSTDKQGEKYCSIKCGYRDKMCAEKICPECDEVHYTEDEYDPYCSDGCRVSAKETSQLQRSCLQCGSVFFAEDKFDEFCTDQCEYDYDDRLQSDESDSDGL